MAAEKTNQPTSVHSGDIARIAQQVARIVSREGDAQTIAKQVCRTISRTPAFAGARVTLFDGAADNGIVAQAGFGRAFPADSSGQRDITCTKSIMKLMANHATLERTHQQEPCASCPVGMKTPTSRSLILKLKYSGKVIGLLALCVSPDVAFSAEQQSLIQGMGTELGLAFHSLRERAAAEARQKENEDLYRTIFENTGTLLWVVEPDGTISLANRMSEALTGYTREETENHKRWDDFFVKRDVLRMQRYRRARLHSGGGRAAKQFQARLISKSGKIRTVLVSPGVVPGTKRMTPSMIDITARKRAEQDVRRLNEYLQGIVDNANLLVVLLDGRGRVRVWNRAAELVTGYSASEVVGKGKPLRTLFPETDQAIHGLFAKFSAGGAIENLEASIVTRAGESRLVSWYAKGIIDPNRRLHGVVVIGRDVTSQREMERQTREAESRAQHAERLAAVGEMAAGVAHEINNPLAGIMGLAELVAREDLTPMAADYVQSILEGGRRISRIVEALLTFARRHSIASEPLSVNECVRRALQSQGVSLQQANVHVQTLLESSEPVVVGDAARLEQVFFNVLVNARDELSELDRERRLVVVTRLARSSVVIEFQDNGRGIPDSCLKKVFEPFFTTKQPGRGTGLGLSICHGLVAEHGGRIYARNNPAGGATFVIELPVQQR